MHKTEHNFFNIIVNGRCHQLSDIIVELVSPERAHGGTKIFDAVNLIIENLKIHFS